MAIVEIIEGMWASDDIDVDFQTESSSNCGVI